MSLNSDRDTGITYTKLHCLLVNLTFVLLITVLFSTLFSLSAYAASTNIPSVKNEFINYENASEGIKIDCPKGWTPIKQYG